MALGDVTLLTPDSAAIELLASATATNGAPTGTAGIDANSVKTLLGFMPSTIRVAVLSTAGSGVMTVSVRLWHRLGALGWVVSKTLNGGSAIAETGTDTIGYSEEVSTVSAPDRFYLEITAIAGTATAVKGLLVVGR